MTSKADLRAKLVQQIAAVRCLHGPRMQDRPCAQCLGGVTRSLRAARPAWVELTARTLVQQDGFTCEPTALVRARALDLLQAVLHTIRRDLGEDDLP